MMRIIGWIREGDRAACGGLVVEGDPLCRSDGRAYSFEGARIDCPTKCVIAEGFQRRTLTNRRHAVIHGMKTSGGCPLISTINEFNGVVNETGAPVPTVFFRNAKGDWIGVCKRAQEESPFDEQVKLAALPIEGIPYFIETHDGRKFSGRTGAGGLLPRIETYGEDEYAIWWGDEALARMTEGQQDG
jgi:uncharacterized Zn-binding protein involved in type VI secretion